MRSSADCQAASSSLPSRTIAAVARRALTSLGAAVESRATARFAAGTEVWDAVAEAVRHGATNAATSLAAGNDTMHGSGHASSISRTREGRTVRWCVGGDGVHSPSGKSQRRVRNRTANCKRLPFQPIPSLADRVCASAWRGSGSSLRRSRNVRVHCSADDDRSCPAHLAHELLPRGQRLPPFGAGREQQLELHRREATGIP